MNLKFIKSIVLIGISVFSVLITLISMSISKDYHSLYIYHHDSAGYRLQSFNTLLSIYNNSLSVIDILKQKECFDVLIRAVFYKSSLGFEYGHLLVSCLFMTIAFIILFGYCYNNTNSITVSLLPVLLSVIFPFYYSPMGGYADYFKESIAVWILVGAIVSYLRSNNLSNNYWALCSGALWGILFFQRSILAVLFLPAMVLILIIYYKRINRISDIIWFTSPIILSIFALSYLQLDDLIAYYTVSVDHSYINLLNNIYYLTYRIPSGSTITLISLAMIAALLIISKPIVTADSVKAFIFTTLFTFIVIIKAPYHSYFAVASVMIMILVSTFRYKVRPKYTYLIIAVILLSGFIQYISIRYDIRKYSDAGASRIKLHEAVASVIASPGLNRPVNLFLMYDEVAPLHDNYMIFRRNLIPGKDYQMAGFVSWHDSYYLRKYGALPKAQIITKSNADNISEISQAQTPILVSYCNANDIYLQNSNFLFDGTEIAVTSAYLTNKFIETNDAFKIIRVVNDNGRLICIRVPKAIINN